MANNDNVSTADALKQRLDQLIKDHEEVPGPVSEELIRITRELQEAEAKRQDQEKQRLEQEQAARDALALERKKVEELERKIASAEAKADLLNGGELPTSGFEDRDDGNLAWDFAAGRFGRLGKGGRFRSGAPAFRHRDERDEEEDEEEGEGEESPSSKLPFDLNADQKVDALAQALQSSFLTLAKGPKSMKEHESAKLTETDPESWITFKDNFLTTAALNEWTPQRAKLKLKAAVRDEAARAVQHIIMDPKWTLRHALAAYEEVFIHPAGVELAQAELERTRKKTDETLLAFHTRLRYLFLRAYPLEKPETSKKLKDLFSTQLGSLALSKELRTSPTYRQESYTSLLTRAQDIEAAYKTLQDTYRQHRSINAIQLYDDEVGPEPTINAMAGSKTRGSGERPADRNNRSKARCHACDSEDHLVRQCPFGKKVLDAVQSRPQQFGLRKGPKGNQNGQNRKGSASRPTVNAMETLPLSTEQAGN